MKTALILKNISHEGAGEYQKILLNSGFQCVETDLSNGENIPQVSFDLIMVMGGPASANDNSPQILNELAFLQQQMQRQTPIFGVCLGLQLAVKAAGGKVERSPVPEIGFQDPDGSLFSIEKTGKDHRLVEQWESSIPVFQLHGETVDLTDSMHLLASGKHCLNQLVLVNNFTVGIQSHIEINREMLIEWHSKDRELGKIPLDFLLKDFAKVSLSMQKNASSLLVNFLEMTKLEPTRS